MGSILLAVLPVFLLIVLGYLLRRFDFLDRRFWDPAERLVYFLLFPALLLTTIAASDLGALTVGPMAAAIVGALLIGAVVLAAVRPLLASTIGLDGPGFTSLFQGCLRMNTYIGLAVAFGVHGQAGLAAASLAIIAIVPLVNLLSVLALARYGSGAAQGKASIARTLRQLATNPLILASLLGLLLNAGGLGLPPVIKELLDILARGTLPLGLLAVGAGLDLAAARVGGHAVLLSLLGKLALLPLVTAGLCLWLGAGPVETFVAVLYNGLPTAATSYILARQLGGDARLMASIITLQVVVSVASLPVILTLLA